jgi:hypothetical protein
MPSFHAGAGPPKNPVAGACLLSDEQSLSLGGGNAGRQSGCGHEMAFGVCTKGFNIRHKWRGHLFAGRYKALIAECGGYLRTVCDYVHLNILSLSG